MGKKRSQNQSELFQLFYLFLFPCYCYWQKEKQYKYACGNQGGEKSEELWFFETSLDLGHAREGMQNSSGEGKTTVKY